MSIDNSARHGKPREIVILPAPGCRRSWEIELMSHVVFHRLLTLVAGLFMVLGSTAPVSAQTSLGLHDDAGLQTLPVSRPEFAGAAPGSRVNLQTGAVVRAVMFWMDSCPHCHYVLDEVLPPLQGKYGNQLEIRLVELVSAADVDLLYKTAAEFGIAKEGVGVPLLVIGEHVLVGSEQIPTELPGLIESYLAAGGVDLPEIPGLGSEPTQTALPSPVPAVTTAPGSVVQTILFSTPDCHECQVVIAQGLRPLKEKYGSQLEIQLVDTVTSEDVEYLYQVAAGFGIPQEQVDLPLLIIGERILMGEEITNELPELVEEYLAEGGVGYALLPSPAAAPTAQSTIDEAPEATPLAQLQLPIDPPAPAGDTAARPDGFALAIGMLVVMAAALIYAVAAFIRGEGIRLGSQIATWQTYAVPFLVLLGLFVAGYLAYVETQAVAAACGPVGDCNTVQSSPYARLFGVLPVGVLGLAGYILIMVAWVFQQRGDGSLKKLASLGLFGMAFFGTLFSLYLTYLEPFVIQAVCMWCLTSAAIITLLLVLSAGPAVRDFNALEQSG
jgi:uncharacterized membrane protein/thiol-disulfide isomerase/thioredoxin